MAKTPEPERRVGALNRKHILPAPSARTEWVVTAPFGALAKDLLDPSCWKHVAVETGLKPNDRVDATSDDGTWFAEYLVLHVGPQHAKLHLLSEHNLEEVGDLAEKTDTHEVIWKGPAHKYVVSRLSDGETIEHGFDSKGAAAAWMARELRNIAA